MKAHLKLTADKGFVPHCLRHTCASRLAQSGVDQYTVQNWLGHTTSKMTARYSWLAPTHLIVGKEAIDRFNEHGPQTRRLVAVK
jgi:integrase